jgi:hypothetical protein
MRVASVLAVLAAVLIASGHTELLAPAARWVVEGVRPVLDAFLSSVGAGHP